MMHFPHRFTRSQEQLEHFALAESRPTHDMRVDGILQIALFVVWEKEVDDLASISSSPPTTVLVI